MDRFLPAILILAVCSSCQIYQTNLLKSDISGTDKEPFTFENDTLRVSYSFNDRSARIKIFNKSDNPLYIDWTRSSVIKGGAAEPYWTEGEETPLEFIPPRSGIEKVPFVLPDVIDSAFTGTKNYTRESSPMKFRSYMLFSFYQDFYRSFSLDHEFWLATTVQSKQPAAASTKPYIYNSSRLTEGGNFAVGFVVIGVPLVLICATADGQD
ncbi:MAG TPA: hypothetical protein VFE50_13470 [Cyclobacteriaceae bacterium]|nr:hypothetical protein [Cyclobacteriaceae bacterium]